MQWTHEDSFCHDVSSARAHINTIVCDLFGALGGAHRSANASLMANAHACGVDSVRDEDGGLESLASSVVVDESCEDIVDVDDPNVPPPLLSSSADKASSAIRSTTSSTAAAAADVIMTENYDEDVSKTTAASPSSREMQRRRPCAFEPTISDSEFTDAVIQHFIAASTPHLTNMLDVEQATATTSPFEEDDSDNNCEVDLQCGGLLSAPHAKVRRVSPTSPSSKRRPALAEGSIWFCDYRRSVQDIASATPTYVFESSECGRTMPVKDRDMSAYFPVLDDEISDGGCGGGDGMANDQYTIKVLENPSTLHVLEEASVEQIRSVDQVPREMLAPMSTIVASDTFWSDLKSASGAEHSADAYSLHYGVNVPAHRDISFCLRNRDGAIRRPTNLRNAVKQIQHKAKHHVTYTGNDKKRADDDDDDDGDVTSLSLSQSLPSPEELPSSPSLNIVVSSPSANSVGAPPDITTDSEAVIATNISRSSISSRKDKHVDIATVFKWDENVELSKCAWLSLLNIVSCFVTHRNRSHVVTCETCMRALDILRYVMSSSSSSPDTIYSLFEDSRSAFAAGATDYNSLRRDMVAYHVSIGCTVYDRDSIVLGKLDQSELQQQQQRARGEKCSRSKLFPCVSCAICCDRGVFYRYVSKLIELYPFLFACALKRSSLSTNVNLDDIDERSSNITNRSTTTATTSYRCPFRSALLAFRRRDLRTLGSLVRCTRRISADMTRVACRAITSAIARYMIQRAFNVHERWLEKRTSTAAADCDGDRADKNCVQQCCACVERARVMQTAIVCMFLMVQSRDTTHHPCNAMVSNEMSMSSGTAAAPQRN